MQALTHRARTSFVSKLKYLYPGWFAIVMGLAGLSLAWHRALPAMGPGAGSTSLVLGVLAALTLAVLGLAAALRAWGHAQAWQEDLRHPVRHAFVATLPISLILVATVAVAHGERGALVQGLWWLGSVAQLLVTVWVVARWWRGNVAGGLVWPGVTPALFIPIVGNVLVPLAGVPLDAAAWSAAQLGVGLLFWPVVTVLVVVRLAVHGAWPDRLLPAAFIFIAPPAVLGLDVLQFGAPWPLAMMCWGMALASLLWCLVLARRIAALPFSLPHWALSFPLAAFTALTLRLGESVGSAMATAGVVSLGATSLVIAALTLATLRGLRDGSLLAPEPVAALQPAAP
jgi:tellurite resistance protein